MTERTFPMQGGGEWAMGPNGCVYRLGGQIPWGLAEVAYRNYVKHYGSSQSLERLAERGGFGWSELLYLLTDDDEAKAPVSVDNPNR